MHDEPDGEVNGEGLEGVVADALGTRRSLVRGVLLGVTVGPGRAGVFDEVLLAAVSAMMLRRSTLIAVKWSRLPSNLAYLSVSTVRDFQTGPLEFADRSSGVMGRDILGVCIPDAAVTGELTSSSMAKMSSTEDELGVGCKSGLVTGEGDDRRPLFVGVTVSVGEITGDLAFHLHGCRTRSVGMSWTASHSLCFSAAWMISVPDRETDSFLSCFIEMTRHRSCSTSSSISSSKPLSSIVSIQDMM